MYKHIFYSILTVFLMAAVSSCKGPEGPMGPEGPAGKPGSIVTISSDGYWIIDGVKQPYKAVGEDGKNGSIPSIGTDGYWYIDGVKQPYKALGESGAPGSVLSIEEDGYWYIDGKKTAYKAVVDISKDNVFKVTFDSDGGSFINPEKVILEGKAKEPKIPLKSSSFVPFNNAEAGLYIASGTTVIVNYAFAGWYDGEELFDFDTPITANIDLKAKWTPYSIDFSGATGATDFDKVIDYVNDNPAEYAFLLDKNINVAGSTTRTLSEAGAKLTLVGLGSERKISLTSQGRILTVGSYGGSLDVELALGNNITLVGLTNGENGSGFDNNNSVLRVNAVLTMLAGSKITGNTSNASTATNGSGAAVFISFNGEGTAFNMKGGTITGNHSTSPIYGTTNGGLNAESGTIITLEGGSITGNSGTTGGDIYADRSYVTLSGAAEVGILTIFANSSSNTTVTVASGWSGNVASLNLWGNNATMSNVVYYWEGATVLEGTGLNATTVAKIPLGNFMNYISPGTTPGTTQPIGATHYIDDTTGVLTLK